VEDAGGALEVLLKDVSWTGKVLPVLWVAGKLDPCKSLEWD